MEPVHAKRLRTRAKVRRFTNALLVAGTLGAVGYSAKELMKPWGRMEFTGLKASCEGPLRTCNGLVKGGDTLWGVRIAGGEFGKTISVAGVDERGVVFITRVHGVSGLSREMSRVDYDGSATNSSGTLDGIVVGRTADPDVARVRSQ
jgi:hypothetical protein